MTSLGQAAPQSDVASTDDVILPQSNRNNTFRFEKEEQRNGRALEQSDEASDMEFATTRERTIRSLRRRAKKKDRKKAIDFGLVESRRAECSHPGLQQAGYSQTCGRGRICSQSAG